KVRFSGRVTAGYVVERAAASEHSGNIAFLHKVVSAEPVLTSEIAGLARTIADRYGGTMADVLRLAIPPRHAAAEARAPARAAPSRAVPDDAARSFLADGGLWARYPAGKSFLTAIASGKAPHAVWSALPGQGWPAEIAQAAAAARSGGRGAVVVVPDARDLAAAEEAMARTAGQAAFVSLAAQLGQAERYRRWLAVRRGEVKIVVGTRSAMFAPVADLGLVAIWDDGDDLHAEPRAPYPHARDVLLIRAHRSAAAALIGGFARTAEAEQLLASGWAKPLVADRQAVRRHAPLIRTAGDDAELAETRRPAPRGCRASRCERPGTHWPPGLCSSRCPGEATSPRPRARGAASEFAARSALARWRSPAEISRCAAAGAASPPGSRAQRAAAQACARW
ncbi:MAG TPA: primosome assembly protein PriA, partial [Streptosporangiaceae bacterium]|nr:primosome assembly protein PriA [Streptosporangiaceae bacterium]